MSRPTLLTGRIPTAIVSGGLLTVSSPHLLSAVTLRLRDDPNRDFPEEIPLLSAYPVFAALP